MQFKPFEVDIRDRQTWLCQPCPASYYRTKGCKDSLLGVKQVRTGVGGLVGVFVGGLLGAGVGRLVAAVGERVGAVGEREGEGVGA